MRGPVIRSLILACLTFLAGDRCIAQQCCGDCNGDGKVTIDELLGSVDRALDGCPLVLKSRIALEGISLPNFSATLTDAVTQGQVTLTAAFGDGIDISLAISEPGALTPRIGLVGNGEFLRYFVVDDGGQETDVSVRLGLTFPVPREPHTIVMSWGEASMSILLDGSLQYPYDQAMIGGVSIKPGSLLAVGSQGPTSTSFTHIAFAAAP
jgi:hypothetical protein